MRDKLVTILKASRTDPCLSTAASNAATILNAMEFPFSGLDLRGIKIPGADLSEALLENTNLTGSDITGTNLRNAFLKKTNFSYCNMEGINFGERANLKGHRDEVNSVSFNIDGSVLASGGKDRLIYV